MRGRDHVVDAIHDPRDLEHVIVHDHVRAIAGERRQFDVPLGDIGM